MPRSCLLLLAVLAPLAACGDTAEPHPLGVDVAVSALERELAPDVSGEDRSALAAGNRAFAFDLFDDLREAPGNLFVSPYSISVALAMTYAGAEGETERQMREVLHYTLAESRLHPAFNRADLDLASRGEEAAGSDDGPFRLRISNSYWAQDDFQFLDTYLDTLAVNYGAVAYQLDFRGDPESARMTINDWVDRQTEGRIDELVPAGAITPITRLVLTNAIYFNAAWDVPFEEADTADGSFQRLDGSTVTAPFMNQVERHRYAEGDGWQAVELRYDAPELAMVLVLPEAGRFEEIEAALGDSFEAIEDALVTHQTTLSMPRFSFSSDFALGESLMRLGMVDAFSGAADFSGMNGARNLFIQAVLHEAFIAVNEAGTEAAAATAVIVGEVSAPPLATITFDHPFLFFIVDHPTGQILFMGRVLDPTAA
jgi:serpin B